MLHAAAFLAARYAIHPLYDAPLNSPDKALAMMGALRKRWRRMAKLLFDAKWRGLLMHGEPSPLKLTYMMNCPPFGMRLPEDEEERSPQRRCCHRRSICPFCYCRDYVINAFDRLVGPATQKGRELWEFREIIRIKTRSDTTLAETTKKIKEIIVGSGRRQQHDMLRPKPVGGIVFHRVRPQRDGEKLTGFDVYRSTLAVVEAGTELRLAKRSTIRLHRDCTKANLARVVGRCFSYPSEWYEQKPGTIMMLLARLTKARVFAAYGECRRSSKETDS